MSFSNEHTVAVKYEQRARLNYRMNKNSAFKVFSSPTNIKFCLLLVSCGTGVYKYDFEIACLFKDCASLNTLLKIPNYHNTDL